jgi:hypothetical protein
MCIICLLVIRGLEHIVSTPCSFTSLFTYTTILLVSTGSEVPCVRAALDTAWEKAKSVSAACLRWIDAKMHEYEVGEGNWSDRCVLNLMLLGAWLSSKAALRLLASCLLAYLLSQ